MTNVTIECKLPDQKLFKFTIYGIVESLNNLYKMTAFYGFNHQLNEWCFYSFEKDLFKDKTYNIVRRAVSEEDIFTIIEIWIIDDRFGLDTIDNEISLMSLRKKEFEQSDIDFITAVENWIVFLN